MVTQVVFVTVQCCQTAMCSGRYCSCSTLPTWVSSLAVSAYHHWKLKVRLGVLTPTCVVLAVFVGFCGGLSADISKFSSISVQLIGRSLGRFFQTFSGYLLFDLLVFCWR